MKHKLKNGRNVEVRLLQNNDNEKLFEFFDKHFSRESKSRFGPHPFDKETIHAICQNPDGEITRLTKRKTLLLTCSSNKE
jgi:diamine N-acetyltransferase